MRSIAEIFSAHEELDSAGRHVNGTDKHGPNHRYGPAYEAILEYYDLRRSDVALMMEIGVADGSSLLAWREIFPAAHCVGVDIHAAARLEGLGLQDRIEFCLGDQRSYDDCRNAAANRQFDLIVEDATHRLDATLLTLLYMWPSVCPGGLYIVEEFANIGEMCLAVEALWSCAKVFSSAGSGGNDEPLVAFRKPFRGRM